MAVVTSNDPLGVLAGGLAVDWTGDIRLVYATAGALIALIGLAFTFTPLGHSERFLASVERSST